MANKVNVDLDMNVEGYVQGIDKATKSTADYETEVRKIKDSTINFRKEIGAAKKDAFNLAATYSKLSTEAKNSQFGQEMALQLNEASEKAADFINLQGDINDGLKTLSSETASLDILTTGIGVLGGAASTAAGAIALFTGNEKDAQKAVVMFTTVQSALNTVTGTYNAIKKIQNVLLVKGAIATNTGAAAQGNYTVSTRAATVAQALFNKVAMANPYVLLATAILTVVSALAAFTIWSNKAEAQEKLETKATEEAKAAKEAYYNSYNSKLSETMGNYTKLQAEWKNLKSEGEKNQWIKDNEKAFHDLGYEINNTAEAENFFVNNESAVIDSFDARARAAAYAAQQIEIYNQALKGTPKEGEKISVREAAKYGISEKGHEVDTHIFSDNEITVTKEDAKKIRDIRLEEAKKTSKELAQERVKAEEDASKKAAEAGIKVYHDTKNKKGGSNKKIVHKYSLEEAEEAVKTWETALKQANINDKPLIKKIKNNIKHWQKEVDRRKLEVGMDVKVKTNVDMLSDFEKKFEEEVKKAEADYMIAFNTGDTSNLDKLWLKWKKAIDARNDYYNSKNLQDPSKSIEVSGNIKLAPALNGLNVEIQKTEQQVKALEDQINNTNWSTLGESGEAVLDALNDDLKDARSKLNELNKIKLSTPEHSIKGISDAISTLESYIQSVDWSTMGEEGSASLEKYIERIRELKDELEQLQEQYDESIKSSSDKAKEALDQQVESINKVGDAIQAAGDLFSALGDLGQEEGFNVMGIVAKAVATVAMSYANALNSASKNWVTWLTFGMSGLATMVSMISAIKQATAGGYAEGGIVGGSSYSGDRILARLNSGEMVLNKRQQKNLFNLLDTDTMPQKGGTMVQVSGVIRGTDLLLVQKNTTKVMERAGNSINF